MHMADALISPAVGGIMWAVSAGLIGYSCKKVKDEADARKIPLMGVLGAFIFTAQMINFTIPATGSSGHLGGGMILSILLGHYAAFLVMASVLIMQSLFFADGGLLALGCNIFNLGFFSCFVAYPLIYRKMVGVHPVQRKITAGSIFAAVIGLQLGSFGVVLETVFSGISELPFGTFVILMQPIHLAIGIFEGLITAAVVVFVWASRPEILIAAAASQPIGKINARKVIAGLLVAAAVVGGALSWFASANPDGLEWAMFKTSGKEELERCGKVHSSLSAVQEETAFLPDYEFKKNGHEPAAETKNESAPSSAEKWPAVDAETSVSGLVGGALTIAMVLLIGFLLKRRKSTA